MAYTAQKRADLKKALASLSEVLAIPHSPIQRDAAIQRFEYTFELFWKWAKLQLLEQEGLDLSSPKSVFREMRTHFGLTEEQIETLLLMANDRNLSVHTYSETLAESLYSRISGYYELMKHCFASSN